MAPTVPFSVVAAFADNPNAGNPAAVVFADIDKYPEDIYGKLARNLNQPATVFISPKPRPESTEKVLHFDIRFFASNGVQFGLCGHGTLAATKAVLNTEYVTEALDAIEFHTKARGNITVWKRPGGLLELTLTPHMVVDPDRGQYALMLRVLKNTFGREVAVNYVGLGTHDWSHFMLVELDEKEHLKELSFNVSALKETGRRVHVFTAKCTTGPERFHSRVFIPGFVPGDEDPVCGTAHCVLTPYWSKKLEIPRGTEIEAKQVSARGGNLRLVWDADVDKIHLKGKMAELVRGEIVMSP